MTDIATSAKVLLIEDHRRTPAAADAVTVRRYRLARLRLDPRRDGDPGRFEHLKRVYD